MANDFIIRNGFISRDSSTVLGSFSATTISGGTFFGNGSGLTGISASITVGSTPITSGTTGRIAFNNSGVYGEDAGLKFYTHTAGYGQTLRINDGAATSIVPFMARNSTWSTNFVVIQNNSRLSGAIGFYNDALSAAMRMSILYRTEFSIVDENSAPNLYVYPTSTWLINQVSVKTSATPTAHLHIGAGTATANSAPIKINSGSLMTTPENGAIEYNNTFHVTNSDATRRHIVTAPNTTKVTAGAPYTNDGYIIVNIGGTDFKLMTTA